MTRKAKHRRFASGIAAILLPLAPAFAADEFYQNKQINFILSSAVGGSYDHNARLIARHWSRYIPGDPNIVVQNMPGAGGIRAANWLYNVAPKDGLTVGMINNTIVFDPLFGNKQAQFDSKKFNWLGTPSQETALFIIWHTVPVHSIEEARKRELIMGASGAGSTPAFFARVLSHVFDLKVRILAGYKSQTESFQAMERGENDGYASPFWSSLKSTHPQWLEEKKVRPLVYYGGVRNAEIPAPYALDLLKDTERHAVMELAQAGLTMGRPVLAPPGVDADKVEMLRKSMTELFRDTNFRAECKKLGLDCSSPMSGKEMVQFVDKIHATPKPAVDKIAEIYMQGLKN